VIDSVKYINTVSFFQMLWNLLKLVLGMTVVVELHWVCIRCFCAFILCNICYFDKSWWNQLCWNCRILV